MFRTQKADSSLKTMRWLVTALLACATSALAVPPTSAAAVTPGQGLAAPVNRPMSARAAAATAAVPLAVAYQRLMSDPTTASIVCLDDVTIESRQNRHFVSTTALPIVGLLRAKGTYAGTTERYQVCRETRTNTWTIRAWLGLYVTTIVPGDPMLMAGSRSVGIAQRYRLVGLGADVAIKSLANDRFVTAEVSESGSRYGMLRARAAVVGGWELFG